MGPKNFSKKIWPKNVSQEKLAQKICSRQIGPKIFPKNGQKEHIGPLKIFTFILRFSRVFLILGLSSDRSRPNKFLFDILFDVLNHQDQTHAKPFIVTSTGDFYWPVISLLVLFWFRWFAFILFWSSLNLNFITLQRGSAESMPLTRGLCCCLWSPFPFVGYVDCVVYSTCCRIFYDCIFVVVW